MAGKGKQGSSKKKGGGSGSDGEPMTAYEIMQAFYKAQREANKQHAETTSYNRSNYGYPTTNNTSNYGYPTTNGASNYGYANTYIATGTPNYGYAGSYTATGTSNYGYNQGAAYLSGGNHGMAYNPYANSAYGAQYGYPAGYNAQYAQQQPQQYQATPPQIRNPFAPPPAPTGSTHSQNANFDPEYEQQVAQWQSNFESADQQERGKKSGKYGPDTANFAPVGQRGAGAGGIDGGDAKGKGAAADDGLTVVRKGGGQSWEDKTLLEWDATKFRIMVGNLAGEVTDDLLSKAFSAYDVSKARVVRDKTTTKSKGYGFVEFNNSDLGFKAAREMDKKYIGSHPVTIKRSRTNVAPVKKKDDKNQGKSQDKKKNNKDKKDPLRANTHAGVEKKQPSKAPSGLKLLG